MTGQVRSHARVMCRQGAVLGTLGALVACGGESPPVRAAPPGARARAPRAPGIHVTSPGQPPSQADVRARCVFAGDQLALELRASCETEAWVSVKVEDGSAPNEVLFHQKLIGPSIPKSEDPPGKVRSCCICFGPLASTTDRRVVSVDISLTSACAQSETAATSPRFSCSVLDSVRDSACCAGLPSCGAIARVEAP
jgi:hypothetical protein